MRSISLLAFSCVLFVAGFSQTGKNLTPDSALNFLNSNYPQEKVYLQTDKTQYVAGESIWMKAWCTLEGVPSFLSRILYVDLVNSSGKVVQKKMYRLDSLSSSAADFSIGGETLTGNYSINAYTLWMRNFPQYLFKKDIFIYNNDYKPQVPKNQVPMLKVQFLPEGGNLVAGIANRVAFKSVDNSGFPVEIKGVIQDNTGKAVTDFSTVHDGMGVVEITPEQGKTYTAVLPVAGGNNLTFLLPQAQEEGITMRIENSNPNRLVVLLNRTEKNKEKYAKLIIVAQMNQQPVLKAVLNLDQGQMALPVSKKNLLPGIMHITVFTEQYEPLAERLAFIENYQLMKPTVKLDTVNKGARAGNQFSFDMGNKIPIALSCLVSSAYLDTALYRESNIASSLLVTSDLQGYIHNPGYYFRNKEASTIKDLDLLLMTQGWRRFEWKKILNNDFAKLMYPVESAISFGGTVTKSDRTEVVKDGKVSFIIKGADSTSILAEATITDKGEFLLKDITYMKDAKVAYMGTNSKAATFIVDVKMKPNYIDSLLTSINKPTINLDTTDLTNQKSLLARYLFREIKLIDTGAGSGYLGNVSVTSKKISKEDSLNKEYAAGPFQMGKGIDPRDFKFARTIWTIIQQAVPGVSVEGNPFDPTVSFTRFTGLGGTDATVAAEDEMSPQGLQETNGIAYFLNEVNVTKDVINSLQPEDVALIKVLKAEGASLGATQGAIVIYTQKNFTAKKAPYEKTYTVEKKAGYSVARQFYRPEYTLNPTMPLDSRVTLYWNANMKPAKDGKYRFRFLNNDIGQQFKLVIQGLDKDGNMIYAEQLVK
ncbi:MAG: hypothetical protein V4557_01860 [Bacteroidota bacterium]